MVVPCLKVAEGGGWQWLTHVQNGVIFQYSETTVMHFLFNLLRIKGLYMFRAVLAHLQEALHKRHLVHCMLVMSDGCTNPGAAN
jgi:hypothetical protein